MPDLLSVLELAGLSITELTRAQKAAQDSNEPLPVVISRLGLMEDTVVVQAISQAYDLPRAPDVNRLSAPIDCSISPSFLRKHKLLPFGVEGSELLMGLIDPDNHVALSAAQFAEERKLRPHIMGFHSWRKAFDRLYPMDTEYSDQTHSKTWRKDAEGLADLTLDAPAVRLVETLMSEAVDSRASDLHIELKPEGGIVRFRVDGYLQPIHSLDRSVAEAIIARLKVLGGLDVANHRKAQDGRTTLSAHGRPIDVRLSVIPAAYGENAVVRLLDRTDISLDLGELGFSNSDVALIEAATRKPQGLFVVSGPTGSGKTTTLYAALNALRAEHRKIVTVEDPIEYFFDDIHQTQLDTAAELSFANTLRAFLRHDPDIILVGEIRDPETAKTAIQAALTGHMVMTTLHANDAASAPTRLLEMGVEPYLLAATLTAVTAQRLVRRTCLRCCGDGCTTCQDGYSGRLVIAETLRINDSDREIIQQGADPVRLRPSIEKSIKDDGLSKVAQNLTTKDEVLRVLELT